MKQDLFISVCNLYSHSGQCTHTRSALTRTNPMNVTFRQTCIVRFHISHTSCCRRQRRFVDSRCGLLHETHSCSSENWLKSSRNPPVPLTLNTRRWQWFASCSVWHTKARQSSMYAARLHFNFYVVRIFQSVGI
jgi:hypothetical protein